MKFTQYCSKLIHISACIPLHISTLSIITVHICTVIVVLQIIILLYSLSHNQILSLVLLSSFSFSSHTLSLFIYTANQQSTHHHSTNATDHHSTNTTHHHHFTTHKNPTINSIENQSQNQGKIQTHPMEKPKSTKIKLKINRNQI